MGILNVTPDSFSDGGRTFDTEAALSHARSMAAEGALIVDVGGESTRPGAKPVPLQEELRRILPVVERLVGTGEVMVSVDTTKPEVARRALAAGAHLVNDQGGLVEPAMVELCATWGVPAVIMHQGPPVLGAETGDDPEAVIGGIGRVLLERAEAALAAGVPGVVLDPGFGFGKSLGENIALVRGIGALCRFGFPVLLGASRKGTIGRLSGSGEPSELDGGSLALHLYAADRGIALVRAHAVALHVRGLRVWEALRG